MTRSSILWVSVVVVLIVGTIIIASLPSRTEIGNENNETASPAPSTKGPRSTAPSKSGRRLDLITAENRDGVLHGKDGEPFTGTVEKEHPAGRRAAQIPMRNGVPHGVVKTYDENGTLRTRAVYENGKLVSKEEWDKDGRKLDGSDRDPYGELLAERERLLNPPTGQGQRPMPLLDAVSPAEGIEIGQLQQRGSITYVAGTRQPYTGRALRRFSDGSTWERHYKDGVRHGEFTYTYPNGQIHSRENYVNGKKDGPYTMYHENGQKRFEVEIVNGRQLGIETSWDPNGKVIGRIEHTEDGKRINLLTPAPAEEQEPPAAAEEQPAEGPAAPAPSGN